MDKGVVNLNDILTKKSDRSLISLLLNYFFSQDPVHHQ